MKLRNIIRKLGRVFIKTWDKLPVQLIVALVIGVFLGFLLITFMRMKSLKEYYQSFGGSVSDVVKCTRVSKEDVKVSNKGILIEMECPFGTKLLSKNTVYYMPKRRRIGVYYSPQGRSWNTVVIGNSSEITVVRSDLKFIGLQRDKYTPDVAIFKEKDTKNIK